MKPGGDQTIRRRIVALIDGSPTPLSGRQIATSCKLSYKQTIDALDALFDQGKITRIGRKHTALWGSVPTLTRHLLDEITLAHLHGGRHVDP